MAAKAALYEAQDSVPEDRAGAYQKAHEAERSSEVAAILLQNATLLRTFASTTASTTATTTGKTATSTKACTEDCDSVK